MTSAGAVSGSSTWVNDCIMVAPSTWAACRSDTGSPRKNAVSTHTVNGRVKIMYDRIIDGMEGMCRTRITAYRPASTAICGNIVIARMT